MPRTKLQAKKEGARKKGEATTGAKGGKMPKANRKTAPSTGGKKFRWRPGTKALREIKRY